MEKSALEIELKYRLENVQAFENVQALLLVDVPPKRVQQRNHFFDTKDHLLRQSKIGFRLRKEDDQYILTAKGPAQAIAGEENPEVLAVHLEEEISVTSEDAKAILAGVQPCFAPFLQEGAHLMHPRLIEKIQEVNQAQALAHVGSFENTRTRIPMTLPLSSGAMDLIFELDQTTFLEKIIHYEVEVEVPAQADAAKVDEAVQALLKQAGVTWTKTPGKASRFFALLGFS